ncbi:hypothetical protein ILUMI_13724 [Ignelater luminosus]|uniref:HTH CENPB-type domain-containing protein n=1 Tax=Ignelater luminosus TaxID=2038154 RepID=A0A8K0CRU4_IGNLU|nr:hypothetical protein ILUMI_13724 [Ignelater luminosus]
MCVNGRQLTLSEEVGEELVTHILSFEKLPFGLTLKDVRKLAYDIVAANPHLRNPFNKETKMAEKWYYLFMPRHQNLNLQQPENMLEKLVDKNVIGAVHVDQAEFSTV